MKNFYTLIISGFFLFISVAAQPETVDTIVSKNTYKPIRIAYGKNEFQFAELRLPETEGLKPVAIVVHGGCYLSKHSFDYMNELSDAITDIGFATWNLEYRRVGNPGGGWPLTFLDVADGTDHLRHIAEKYTLNLDQTIVVGHSSGGQLGIWLAGRDKISSTSELYRPAPLPIQTSVALAPVADIARRYRQENCDNSAEKLMGGSPGSQKERYKQVSPVEMLPINANQIVLLGEQDTQTRKEETSEYMDKAKATGSHAEFLWLKNSNHFTFLKPEEPAGQEVLRVIKTLFAN